MKSQNCIRLILALVLLAVGTWSPASAASQSQSPAAALPPVDPACGLLGGITIDAMESTDGWSKSTGNSAISVALKTGPGFANLGFQVDYNLGSTPGAYVQIKREYNIPLDLSTYDHLRFLYKGNAKNTMEVGLVTADGNYFATPWNNVTHVGWWTYATIDLHDFRKNGLIITDFSKIKAIFISITLGKGSTGGEGQFFIDQIQGLNLASRPVSHAFSPLPYGLAGLEGAAAKAADWISSQQVMPGGLVKSWQEENADNAWLYDQALALLVMRKTHPQAAHTLAYRLHQLQNSDGSWYGGYHTGTLQPLMNSTPVGAQAWTVFALTRYAQQFADPVIQTDAGKGAGWLAALQREDGSLPAETGDSTAPTEPNLDAWFAFRAAGYWKQSSALAKFLSSQVWDKQVGRFNSSQNTVEINLDNQTWGAAFLRATGGDQDARRALSYARWTLGTSSSAGLRCGLDGKGPFSTWNEGTMQYAAAQGENSMIYWQSVAAQQAADGGIPGSPETFASDMVWLTTMHGVAPTAWFYFASTSSPLPMYPVFLPVVRQP